MYWKPETLLCNKGPYSQDSGLPSGHVWLWELDCKERQNAKELIPLNCGSGEESWKSLGQQGDQTSQSYRKSTLNTLWKDWCWSWNSNILATWCKELTHWKRLWCWERLKVDGKEGDKMRCLDGIINSVDMNLGKLREMVRDKCSQSDTTWWLNNNHNFHCG